MSDMRALSTASAELRGKRAQLRRDLRCGATTLDALFADIPDYARRLTVLDVVSMLRNSPRDNQNTWLTEIGREAVLARVNVLVRLDHASARTLAWAVVHGQARVRIRSAA